MNIQQSLAFSDLARGSKPVDHLNREPTANARQIAERVFVLAKGQGRSFKGTPAVWQNEWLQSEKFVLLDVPLYFAACPRRATDRNKVLGCLQARSEEHTSELQSQ